MTLERSLALHACNADYARLGQAAQRAALAGCLDTIGCMVAASAAPGIPAVADIARHWGGRPEACVIGHALAVPAPVGAWVNGTMARALEIDDCTDFLPLHPSAAVVPALLALAQSRPGVPMRGHDLLAAVALGQDLVVRFGMATRIDGISSGRYNLFKIFAIVAAGARLLRLDVPRTQEAMGIAYAFACGEGQSAVEGALAFRIHEGNAAQAALTALLLAERNFTGAHSFLGGSMGFFASFEPHPRLEQLTDGLGERFQGERLSIKPYACCRCTHTAIGLVQEHLAAHPADKALALRTITVRVAPGVHKLVGAALAEESPSQAAGQFSIAWTLATAWLRGDVFLEQFTPAALADREVLDLARRVRVLSDASLHDAQFVLGRTRIDLEFADGRELHLEGIEPPGNPAKPLAWEAVRDKFRKCVHYGRGASGQVLAEGMIAAVEQLPDAPHLHELLQWVR